MGQYYKPLFLKDDKINVESFAYSHDYNNGLKLMEHSWIGNDFVARIEQEILNNPKRIVWAGDYAEADKNEYDEFYHKDSDGDGKNLYTLCDDELKLSKLACKRIAKYRYLVNHDKKEFVDLYYSKLPITDTYTDDKGKVHKYVVHPLPLLTSEGNGLGGGDYRSSNGAKYIGTWARDLISLETEIINPEDFTEIKPNFKE